MNYRNTSCQLKQFNKGNKEDGRRSNELQENKLSAEAM